MRFSAFALTALLPLTTLASPLPSTDSAAVELVARAGSKAPAVIKDLHKLHPQIARLDHTLNTVPDNAQSIPFSTLETLQSEVQAIEKTLGALGRSAKSSGRFSPGQSHAVAAAFHADEGILFATLRNFIAHKQAAQNSGAVSTIHSGLVKLRNQVTAAANAMKSKAVGKYSKEIAAAEKAYDAHFGAAIRAYA